MGRNFNREDTSSAMEGDKAAAKRVMYVVSPVIIVVMAAWTFGAVFFMNMIFTKVGTARGIISSVPEGGDEVVELPIVAEKGIRIACENGEYRYDLFLNNRYEMAIIGQPFNFETGTYTIEESTITLTSEEGKSTDANYDGRVLLVGHEPYNCREYDNE